MLHSNNNKNDSTSDKNNDNKLMILTGISLAFSNNRKGI